jgi:hypothetical protein
MELLIGCVLIGLIPAAIAHNKGYSFIVWWFFGAALFIVALPVALCLKRLHNEKTERKCPACMEWVNRDARVCRYCRSELPPIKPDQPDPPELPTMADSVAWALRQDPPPPPSTRTGRSLGH